MALTRWRGNALATRQRRVIPKDWTLARPEWIPTPARGNQKKCFNNNKLQKLSEPLIQTI